MIQTILYALLIAVLWALVCVLVGWIIGCAAVLIHNAMFRPTDRTGRSRAQSDRLNRWEGL